jgi:hypothetical protein
MLVSRLWSGKTLEDHRADRAAVVRAALEEAGIDPDDHQEFSIAGSDGRWAWHVLGRSGVDAHTYARAIAESIANRQRWRAQYEVAKTRASPPVRCTVAEGNGRAERSERGAAQAVEGR